MIPLLERLRAERKASDADRLKRIVDGFDWEAWNEELRPQLEADFAVVVKAQGEATAEAMGVTFRHADPFVRRSVTSYVGERIKSLDEVTRARVSDLVAGAIEDGAGSTGDLGDLIGDLVKETFEGFADWRADTIARTETAIAYNHGTVFACRQNGVKRVVVSDGDDDEECAAADGQVWDLDYALEHPLAHPNCERAFSPAPEEDE